MRYEYHQHTLACEGRPTLAELERERREAQQRVMVKRAFRRALIAAGVTGVTIR